MIRLNEKFAFAACAAEIAIDLPQTVLLSEEVQTTRKLPLEINERWTRWLGTARTDYLTRDSTLFLYTSLNSQTAGILDRENTELMGRVSNLFEALLLTGNIATRAPILATGAHDNYGISLRQTRETAAPLHSGGLHFDRVDERMLKEAFDLMSARRRFNTTARYDRIQRIFYIFVEAQREPNPHERLHQFCRTIEGLILPDAGKTQRQFASRTELFIGPHYHGLMRRLYEMRSRVEHMHDYEFRADLSERDRRIEVMRMAAFAGYLAKHCLRHFLLTPVLWPHYATAEALAAFWKLDVAERQLIWGEPINVTDFDRIFNLSFLTDKALGLET